jgi:hypothetical protein
MRIPYQKDVYGYFVVNGRSKKECLDKYHRGDFDEDFVNKEYIVPDEKNIEWEVVKNERNKKDE